MRVILTNNITIIKRKIEFVIGNRIPGMNMNDEKQMINFLMENSDIKELFFNKPIYSFEFDSV